MTTQDVLVPAAPTRRFPERGERQARARNIERLGRYHRTLRPGLNFVIPFADRVYPAIDLREQVVSFAPAGHHRAARGGLSEATF